MYELESSNAAQGMVAVVGCGGTGAFVAEGLCRLLPPSTPLLLIDPDRVEERNLLRQHFYPSELGDFKSRALANRLARQFRRPVTYSVRRLQEADEGAAGRLSMSRVSLYVGCVDNAAARREVHQRIGRPNVSYWQGRRVSASTWWVDAGNAELFGQVLVGNLAQPDYFIKDLWDRDTGRWTLAPAPSVQQPSLLLDLADPVPVDPSCAELPDLLGGQSPTINHAMASLVLEVVRRLLANDCPWLGLYLDLSRGTLSPVYATPANVARPIGVTARRLVGQEEAAREPG